MQKYQDLLQRSYWNWSLGMQELIPLSKIFTATGELEWVADVRKLMRNRVIIKKKAQTWIEINGTVHSFESGDKSHPSHKYIARYLERLEERIREVGYVPNTDVVVQDGVVKEDIVLGH